MGIAGDFVLIVVAGLVGGLVARLFRLPLLVGYVVAGIMVGPHSGGPTVSQIDQIELLAEIGVALLLFSLGLELSLRELASVRRVALIGGPIQILLTWAGGTILSHLLVGSSYSESLWFGAMVSLSSTMVVLKILSNSGTTSSLASRVMIGLLIVQDLAVIPMLANLPRLSELDGAFLPIIRSIVLSIGIIGAIFLLGHTLLPRLLRHVLIWGSRELFLVSVVAIGIGVGYATHLVGLSFALGAFVAGIILSESEYSSQALSDVVPLRDIFGLLFFVTVGMLFDPRYAWEHLGTIVSLVGMIFLCKAVVIGGISRMFGYGLMAPWIIGLGLSQIGEFSFVIARFGLGTGALSKESYDLALTCTVLTMALSPLVFSAALPLGRRWPFRIRREIAASAPPQELFGHTIIGGFGRSGRAAARVIKAASIPVIVVDSNHALLHEAQQAGFEAIWGDITRPEILQAAHIDKANLLLLTMPDPQSLQLSIQEAQRLNRNINIIARAVREHHLHELRRLNVRAAVQPEFEGGIEMVRQALVNYNFDGNVTNQLIDEVRTEIYGPTALP